MSNRDFKSTNIRTNRIIGSGSVSHSEPSLMIYSSSNASNFVGGAADTSMLGNVGTDVFLFISGTKYMTAGTGTPSYARNSALRKNVALFGGDVVISGTMYAENILGEVDMTTTGSLSVEGPLFISGSTILNRGLTVNDSFVNTNSLKIDSGATTGKGIYVDVTSLTTGNGVYVDVGTNRTTGGGIRVEDTGTGDSAGALVSIHQFGNRAGTAASEGLLVNFDTVANTAARAFRIDSEQTTGVVAEIDADAITTGIALDISTDARTTGTGLSVSDSATNDSAGSLVKISQTGSRAGSAASIGLDIDFNTVANAAARALRIDSEQTTGVVAEINGDAVTTGTAVDISTDARTTGTALNISDSATNDNAGSLVKISQTGSRAGSAASIGLDIDFNTVANAAARAFRIDSEQTTGVVAEINGDAVTTGTVVDISADGLTTGTALNIVSDSSDTGNRTLVKVTNDNTAAVGVQMMHLKNDAIGATDDAILLVESTAAETEALLELRNSNAATDKPPILKFHRSDASAEADDMQIGTIKFDAVDDGNNTTTYASIDAKASDITNGVEGGQLEFKVMAGAHLAGAAGLGTVLRLGGEDLANGQFPVAAFMSASAVVEKDVTFFVSGSNQRGLSKGGTSLFGGDVVTSGSLYVLSDLEVADDLTVGDDLLLNSDGAVVKFGADAEVTLTHVHNTGLLLSDDSGVGTTQLQFGDGGTFIAQASDGNLEIEADTTLIIDTPIVDFQDDGTILKFGDDSEVTLTHVHNTGLLLSDASGVGSTKLMFGDSASFIQQQEDGLLRASSDTKLRIDSPILAFTASNESAFSGDFRVGTLNKTHGIFADHSIDQVQVLSDVDLAAALASGFADVNFFVSGSAGDSGGTVRGTSMFGGDVVISGGVVFNDSAHVGGDLRAESSGRTHAIFVDSSTNQVFILSGSTSDKTSAPESAFPDLAFFVSGAIGSRGTSQKGASVFGGDVVVSGAMHLNPTQNAAGDFIVASDAHTHLIFADASANAVSIGVSTDAPSGILEVAGASNSVKNTVNIVHTEDSQDALFIGVDALTGGRAIKVGSTSGARTAELVLIEDGATNTGAANSILKLKKINTNASDTNAIVGLDIDYDGIAGTAARAFRIDSEQTTGIVAEINGDGITTGAAVDISTDARTTGTALNISDSATNDNAGSLVKISQTGSRAGTAASVGLEIDFNTVANPAARALKIDSEQTTGIVAEIDGNAVTTGAVLIVSGNAVTTGEVFKAVGKSEVTLLSLGQTAGNIGSPQAIFLSSSGVPNLDVSFFVSGSNKRGGIEGGTALFGGDVYMSGNLHIERNLYVETAGSAFRSTISVDSTGDFTLATDGASDNADITLDAEGEIILDAGSYGHARFMKAGDDYLSIHNGHQAAFSIPREAVVFEVTNDSEDFVFAQYDNKQLLRMTDTSQILFLSGGAEKSVNEALYADMNFFVSGAVGSQGTSEKGTAVFGGDVVISGALHGGSPLVIGSDLQITGAFDVSGGFEGGAVFNDNGNEFDFRVESNNKTHALFVDASTDQVLILSGGAETSLHAPNFTDVNFYVSGAMGSANSSDKGTALFGGDLAVSGGVHIGKGSGANLTIYGDSTLEPALLLQSTEDGATGPFQQFNLMSASPADDDILGQVFFSGLDSGGAATHYGSIKAQSSDVTNGDEGGKLSFQVFMGGTGGTASSREILSLGGEDVANDTPCEVVVNDGSNIVNFRVESNNKTHAAYVDGAIDRVAILSGSGVSGGDGVDVSFFVSGAVGDRGSITSKRGTSVFGGDTIISGSAFVVGDLKAESGLSGSLTQLSDGRSYLRAGSNITITSASNGQILLAAASGGSGEWTDGGAFVYLTDGVNESVVIGGDDVASADIYLKGDGSAIFNGQGASVDFRIESNNLTHAVFVDGSADQVLVGAPSGDITSNAKLVISSSTDASLLHLNVNTPNVARTNSIMSVQSGSAFVFNLDKHGKAIFNADFDAQSNQTVSGDVIFFVSGSTNVSDRHTGRGKVALFGGNVITSGSIIPGVDSAVDLGGENNRFRNIYTGDLHLSNMARGGNDIDGTSGNWTIQEGEEDLYVINNITGKKYKMNLTPLDD